MRAKDSHTLPPVTVLMPVYNAEATIRNAIDSILTQTYPLFEFLIIDDGSSDTTPDIIASYSDIRIRCVRIEHQGLGAALNFGLQIATNEIIARMDADDISVPERLAVQVAEFVNLPDNTIMSNWYGLFSNSTLTGIVKGPVQHEQIYARLALHNEITHSGAVYRKSFINSEGGYCNQIFEDFELWIRIRNKANFVILPKVLTLVRVNLNSLSRASQIDKNGLILALLNRTACTPEQISREFKLHTLKAARQIPGWREYFFGSKNNARSLWLQTGLHAFLNPSILLALTATLLPDNLFRKFKDSQLRFRIMLFFLYLSPEISKIRKLLIEYNKTVSSRS
ncbi:MAG: glycosyltransferase [Ignavibacteria bacterium]|nr:glycosyltransferase [Ignavibacteria bacterium]